ncbi:RNA polymerase II-associated protein 3-like [Oopsacas minuta]|uniref:RNA polymerase II-associated protein 3 n=1 Tax=Oopsacas minuta TaxID=111878 RepID=A0AAV7JX41_9METZ|nr:RNA polymerase II-associated protein 3-like [Oopsacas minuta]
MSAESKAFNLQNQVRINASELQDYLRELDNWESDSKQKDRSISDSKSILKPTIPPVRNASNISLKQKQRQKNESKKDINKKGKRKDKINAYDYSAWDKLDVDGALQEMDSSSESEVEDNSDNSGRDDEEIQEERAEAERKIGNEHFKAMKYREAIEHYSRSIQMNPHSESTLTNRALALIKIDKYAAAEQDCTDVLHSNPKNVKALYRRGLARYNLEHYEAARSDFNNCLELEPNNQPAKDYIHKIHVNLNPELEGQFKAVEKPQHLMSKKPMIKVQIEEVGSGSGTESDDGERIPKSSTEIMSEIFETSKEDTPHHEPENVQKIVRKVALPSSPPRPITVPTAPTTNSSQFMNNWKTLKKEPELFFKYFHSIPPNQYPKLLVQFLENDGLTHLLRLFTDFYIHNELTYLEELTYIAQVPRFNVATMFLSKEDKARCQQLFQNIKDSSADLSVLAKLYSISLH